ncbi:hypothetical protein [Mammaliicoccus sciuri]|uniref:hypothetical protein n=1 Tax=Mammaliicoccus sciuri TaxID=1296 RepID=UPI0021D32D31|nr:hypothetical protein [Mammaliicoccus sciuri]UXU70246.1 hypothetical protein MUA36_06055 [Mammaliicoccus sciuri]
MSSYKSTQIDIENNARMFIRTGDTEIEINVKPIEVKAEHKKKFKNGASEFREERLNNEKENSYKRDMVESHLVENHNLVITNRGVGRSHQTVLYMIDDPKVITLVRDQYQKKNLLNIVDKLIGKDDGRYEHIKSRIVAFKVWEEGKASCAYYNIVLHIDNVEHYLEYKLGRHVSSFTTGHRAVSGFTHEFNKAEEV